jgi:hypothetical protein
VRDLIGEVGLQTLTQGYTGTPLTAKQFALHSLFTSCRHSAVARGVLGSQGSVASVLASVASGLSQIIELWNNQVPAFFYNKKFVINKYVYIHVIQNSQAVPPLPNQRTLIHGPILEDCVVIP